MNSVQGEGRRREYGKDKFQHIEQFIDICCKGRLDENDIKEAVEHLRLLYSDGDYRHRYSEIAKHLGTQPLDSIVEGLGNGINSIENSNAYKQLISRDNEGPKIKVSSEKLFDTLDLEIYRLMREKKIDNKLAELKYDRDMGEDIQNVHEEILQASENISRLKKESEEASNKATTASEDAKRINAQSMSTLGVFTAIMFAFTGGFSLIGSAFSAIRGVNRNEMLLMISLVLFVGCLLSDIIYALMRFLERMNSTARGLNKSSVKDTEKSLIPSKKEEKGNNGKSMGEFFKHPIKISRGYVQDKKTQFKKMTLTDRVIIFNILAALIILFLLIFNYSWATPNWNNGVDNKAAQCTVSYQCDKIDEDNTAVNASDQ